MGVERGGEPSGGEGGGARDDLGSLEDDLAGTGPMQTREEISSRPWRSAIARLTVEARNGGPSVPGNGDLRRPATGAGGAMRKAIRRPLS